MQLALYMAELPLFVKPLGSGQCDFFGTSRDDGVEPSTLMIVALDLGQKAFDQLDTGDLFAS
jgi:hypothetical protein